MIGLLEAGTKLSDRVKTNIGRRVPKLGESIASRKLLAMLRNTQLSYPTMKIMKRRGAFGVFTDDGTYLYVNYSGSLTDLEKRDLLALFATWLIADPDGLLPESTTQDG